MLKSWTKTQLFLLLSSLLTKAKNEEVNNFFVSKKVLTYEHKTRRKAIFLFQLIFSLESNKSLIFGSSHQIDSYSAGFLCRFRNINDGKAHLSTGQTVLDAMASHFLPDRQILARSGKFFFHPEKEQERDAAACAMRCEWGGSTIFSTDDAVPPWPDFWHKFL